MCILLLTKVHALLKQKNAIERDREAVFRDCTKCERCGYGQKWRQAAGSYGYCDRW